MYKLLAISVFCLLSSPGKTQDLIILRYRDTLNVTITKNAPDVVEFKYGDESMINAVSRKDIHKIIFGNGREEICNEEKNLPTINGKQDWEKVIITFEENDIKGLVQCGTVVGKSGWGCAVSVPAGKAAMKDMKKDAAEIGAPIILIVKGWHKEKDKPLSGYGRGVKLTGQAYKIAGLSNFK